MALRTLTTMGNSARRETQAGRGGGYLPLHPSSRPPSSPLNKPQKAGESYHNIHLSLERWRWNTKDLSISTPGARN